jgi:hypothetical protein
MNDEIDDIDWQGKKTFLNLLKPKHHSSIIWKDDA